MSMDLKAFVTATIRDVLEGVADAQRIEEIGSGVALPAVDDLSFPPDSGVIAGTSHMATAIKFDVAIAAEESDATKGHGGLKVAVFSIGLEGEASKQSSTVSRIQFSVPVRFPRPKSKTPSLVETE